MHITEHASPCRISIHALLAESDTTRHISPLTQSHFYPRSPCGERPILGNPCAGCPAISIHALLAESDVPKGPLWVVPAKFLSTLSLRRATSKNAAIGKPTLISIHALLAESDIIPICMCVTASISIHALLAESDNTSPGAKSTTPISIHALLAESDTPRCRQHSRARRFLSTLSLRRATIQPHQGPGQHPDFYPRSPCGERLWTGGKIIWRLVYFYPRSPCGERHHFCGPAL